MLNIIKLLNIVNLHELAVFKITLFILKELNNADTQALSAFKVILIKTMALLVSKNVRLPTKEASKEG